MLPELIAGLDAIVPTVYGAWKPGTAPPLPYIAIVDTGRDDMYADDMIYHRDYTYRIEFYFENKDPKVEQTIESFFDAHDFAYDSDGDEYIDTEKMFERIYYLEKGESTHD